MDLLKVECFMLKKLYSGRLSIDHLYSLGNNEIDSSALAEVTINRRDGETMTSDRSRRRKREKKARGESNLRVPTTTHERRESSTWAEYKKARASAKRGSFRTLSV